MKHYTGVGSRKTPNEILTMMYHLGQALGLDGCVLRSGGALGADNAFEQGCDYVKGAKEIYVANDATPEAMDIAKQFHPAWSACNEYARKLHGRNSFQVLGRGLDVCSAALICWTPDGCVEHKTRTRVTGGTGTAISIASHHGVRVFNLARAEHRDHFREYLRNHGFDY